VLGNTN